MRLYVFQILGLRNFSMSIQVEGKTLRDAWKEAKKQFRRIFTSNPLGYCIRSDYSLVTKGGDWTPWEAIGDRRILREIKELDNEMQMFHKLSKA